MNSPESSPSPPPIGQAHLQFIEQTFAEFLGEAQPGDPALDARRMELIRWIHHRLFEDRVSVSAVRSELNIARRQTRIIAVTSGKGGVRRA